MKTLSLIAALTLFAVLGAGAQTLTDVSAKYDEAVAKGQAKELAAAITLFEEVVTMGEAVGEEAAELVTNAKGSLPQLYVFQAQKLAMSKQFDDALSMLDKAMGSDDATWSGNARKLSAQIVNVLAGTAWNAQDFAKAATYYGKLHEMSPGDLKVATQLAESYGKQKEYEKAYTIFNELISGEGDIATAAKSRLGFYMLLNANEIKDAEPAKAIEILERSVAVDGDAQAYQLLINIAASGKNYDKVIEFGDKAAEAQSDAATKSNIYASLGLAYQQKGDDAKAIESLRKVTAGPNVANAKATIASIEAAAK